MNLMQRFNYLKAGNDFVKQQIVEKKSQVEKLSLDAKSCETLRAAIQQAALYTQSTIQKRFNDIVQSCLDVVFPNSYKFNLEFVCRRGKTEVDIYLQDGENKLNPMTANGGGVVDVISFALRIAALTFSKFDKVLILDESFPHLRGDARNQIGLVIEEFSKKLGIQFIMVGDVAGTNIRADKVFEVTKSNGVSKVVEV